MDNVIDPGKADRKNRIATIDAIRGFSVLSMILYHFCWDLRYIANFRMDWYTTYPAYIWQQSICQAFILVSGFCVPQSKHPVKNGIKVSLCGALVTAVTLVFLPEDRVVFGVLTLIGASMILAGVYHMIVKRIGAHGKLQVIAGLIIYAVLFILTKELSSGYIGIFSLKLMKVPEGLYHGYFMTFLGFMDRTFYSTDYFALMPWFFLFMCGYFAGRLYREIKYADVKAGIDDHQDMDRNIDSGHKGQDQRRISPVARVLMWIGRHSLIIYMLHQPVLYLITMLLMLI